MSRILVALRATASTHSSGIIAGMCPGKCRSINTESRSTVVVYCVRTGSGRHYRYIVNKGTGDDGEYGCEFIIIVLGVNGQEESALS